MPPALRHVANLLALAAAPALFGAAAARQVAVGPAPVARAGQVVTLTLPRELAAGAILRDNRGQPVPLQIEPDLSAKFIVARQAAGETLRFTLEPGRTPEQGNVQVVEEPTPPRPGATAALAAATNPSLLQAKTGRLRVSVGGRAILYYQMDRDAVPRDDIDPALRRAGYLHPVLTPRGVTVTEDYPLDDPSQHGLFPLGPAIIQPPTSAGVVGIDPAPAWLEFGGVDNTWSGPVHGGFTSWHRWVTGPDPGAEVLVNESWELTAYNAPKELGEVHLFDLTVIQTKVTPGPLYFEDRGLGLRGPAGWESTALPAVLTSPSGPAKQLRWLGLNDRSKEDSAGIVLLHPADGTDAYGHGPMSPTFVIAKPPAREVLKPEFTARGRFSHRIVVFDGPPDNALLEALWNGHTVPAVVTLTPTER